jgi:hypothetical protein
VDVGSLEHKLDNNDTCCGVPDADTLHVLVAASSVAMTELVVQVSAIVLVPVPVLALVLVLVLVAVKEPRGCSSSS